MTNLTLLIAFLFSINTSFAMSETQKLDKAWKLGKKQIYPKKLEKEFNAKNYNLIKRKISNGQTLAQAMNPFLNSLGVSHTQIYDTTTSTYYVLKSMFDVRDINRPIFTTIGAQLTKVKSGLKIKSLLESFPAIKVGLKVGDVITKINDQKNINEATLHHYQNKSVSLTVLKGNKTKVVKITPMAASIHKSLLEATKNSIKIIRKGKKKLGYIHLWSGTDKLFQKVLKEAVLSKLKNTDGIILDLRDGYGGAWWDYLDPFFPDSKNYFKATQLTKDGNKNQFLPPQKKNSPFYSKPMVVLINSGVRSGKESLAYQFKKTKRATLIGETTAGAFTAGFGGFSKDNYGFIFYVSSAEMLLDGNKVEGVGIRPDLVVHNSIYGVDSQLEKAIQIMFSSKS